MRSGNAGTCGSTAASPSSSDCGSRTSVTATWTTRRRARRASPRGQDRHPDRVGLTELDSEAQQAALRYTEALTRAADTDPDAAFQRLYDALAEHFTPDEMLDRRRCRQHERLDTDQACRDRDAGPVGPYPPVTMNRAVPRPCRRTAAVEGGWLTRSRRRSRPREPSTAGRSRRLSPSTTSCATRGDDPASARATRRSD
jgi:hypothetical protein